MKKKKREQLKEERKREGRIDKIFILMFFFNLIKTDGIEKAVNLRYKY